MDRQQTNQVILSILLIAIDEYPDMRFGQLLSVLNILETEVGEDLMAKLRDPFYNESTDILERIQKSRMYQDLGL